MPPGLVHRFFLWFCHKDLLPGIEGDLLELYDERLREKGKAKADVRFILDVLLLFRPGIIRPLEDVNQLNNYGMFKNYLKIGVRNILKYKVFSFINVFGLSTAMSVCMLVILMLADQHRYDHFNTNRDRIYRIRSGAETSRQPYATSPFPLAAALKAEYPIVQESTVLSPEVGGDAFYGQHIADMRGYFASPTFFKIFDFNLEQGNKATSLAAPNSMVISQALAGQLFGKENPMGKTIEFSDRQLPFPQRFDGIGSAPVSWGSFTVTGVIDEAKYKSHLQFDVLISASSRDALYASNKLKDLSNDWEWYYKHYTFVLLAPGNGEDDLARSLDDLVAHKYANLKSDQVKGFKLTGQKLTDVQMGLTGNDTNNRLPGFGYYFLYSLAAIIMTLACLNYTNLSIARALTRAKEIGVRKVTGANRRSLIVQFLSESVITSLLALAMAIILLLFITPAFKGLWVNQYLNFELPSSVSVYVIFTGFAVLIGIIAGIYPAFHLSTYQPIQALKDLNNVKPGRLGLRKVLSVTQFVVSLFFITTSVLIYNQFRYFVQFDYGFDSKDIVNIELQGTDYQKLAHELGAIPGVYAISATDIIPSTGRSNGIQLNVDDSTKVTEGQVMNIDENFLANLRLPIIAGKNLPAKGESADRFIVVNESAVRKLGYLHPSEIIGEVFQTWAGPLEVIGVVQNFRSDLLLNTTEIRPLVLRNQPTQFMYLNVKISGHDRMGTVAKLEQKWKAVDPVHAFKYEFFEDQLADTHQGIFDAVSIVGFIAILAISIACLGLLGMATYTAERKAKEVGIRKVLGAHEMGIAVLLSKEFLNMLAVSVFIGAPLSYFANDLWLQNLPNRVGFGWGTLLVGVSVLVVLGLLTIGSQTLRASRRNPVDALKMD